MKTRSVLIAFLMTAATMALWPAAGHHQATTEVSLDAASLEKSWGFSQQVDQDLIRGYLDAVDEVGLEIALTIDDGRGPSEDARLGIIRARNGTVLGFEARFERPEGGEAPILHTLSLRPTVPFRLGPLRIEGLGMKPGGELCFDFALKVLILKRSRSLCVTSVVQDTEGNLTFGIGGTSRVKKALPALRIRADGVVQRFKRKRFLFWSWDGTWEDLRSRDGEAQPVPFPISVPSWPPSLADVLLWLPATGKAGEADETAAGGESGTLQAQASPSEAIPITRLQLVFAASMAEGIFDLEDGGGRLRITDHALEMEIDGSFEGRSFKTRGAASNRIEARCQVAGEIAQPSRELEIRDLGLRFQGELAALLPFDNPEDLEVSLRFDVDTDLDVSRFRMTTSEGAVVESPQGFTAGVKGKGGVVLTRLLASGDPNIRMAIDDGSEFSLRIPGPLVVREAQRLAQLPLLVPPAELTLVAPPSEAPGGKSLLFLEGTLGSWSARATSPQDGAPRRNLIFLDADFGLGAAIDSPLALRTAAEGASSFFSEIAPGAFVRLNGHVFGAVGQGPAEGGARVSVSAELDGSLAGTRLETPLLAVDIPGPIALSAGLEVNVRFFPPSGETWEVRSGSARMAVGLGGSGGDLRLKTPLGVDLAGRLAGGSRVSFATGQLNRILDRRGLESKGWKHGELAGALGGTILLSLGGGDGGSGAGVAGKAQLDLDGRFGFQIDPFALASEPAAPLLIGPVLTDLKLGIEIGAGAVLGSPAGPPAVVLKAPLKINLHSTGAYDPAAGLAAGDAIELLVDRPIDIDLTLRSD